MIRSFAARLFKINAFEMGELIVNKSGIRKLYFEDGSPESMNRRDNIEELLSGLQDFVRSDSEPEASEGLRTLDEFMQDISLLTDADTQDDDPQNTNKVSLMTVHAAKGLEFPYVFIAGVEENLFPSQLSINSQEELEEERRLFYVAITRAMKQATITWAETRFRYGNFNLCEPSRFIDELDAEYVNYLSAPGRKRLKSTTQESFAESRNRFRKLTENMEDPASSARSANSADSEPAEGGFAILEPDTLSVNMEVKHQRFGKGKVLALEGSGKSAKATVMFAGAGKKQLLLKFARLKIL